MALGTIVTREGARYTLTERDLVWAARMVVGEGATDGPAVLWAMTQRFMLPQVRRRFRTFSSFIRAYSQPINPRWTRGGEFCRPGGRFSRTRLCRPEVLDRRDRVARLRSSEIPRSVREVVRRWSQARLPNPVPRTTDFASREIRARPVFVLTFAKRNLFYGLRGVTERWGPNQVVIRLGRRVASAVPAVGGFLVVAAIVSGAIWLASRLSR